MVTRLQCPPHTKCCDASWCRELPSADGYRYRAGSKRQQARFFIHRWPRLTDDSATRATCRNLQRQQEQDPCPEGSNTSSFLRFADGVWPCSISPAARVGVVRSGVAAGTAGETPSRALPSSVHQMTGTVSYSRALGTVVIYSEATIIAIFNDLRSAGNTCVTTWLVTTLRVQTLSISSSLLEHFTR